MRLFREIMSACLAQEEPLKVGYLGPEGTFTQQAVLKHFGHSVHALAVPTIDEVFHEVESGTADFGVVPIENSSEGTVNIHARHVPDVAAQDLRRGRAAHPPEPDGPHAGPEGHQARLLASAVARAMPRLACTSTCRTPNGAGREQRRSRAPRARRGGHRGDRRRGRREGLRPADAVQHRIEDRDDNTTRFLVIGRKLFPASGKDKTSLLVSAANTEARASCCACSGRSHARRST